eukprot:13971412-Alexandrium_andersonii.AAC.1
MGGFWGLHSVPQRALRSVFLAMVQNPLYSGMDCYVLSAVHEKRMDRCMLRYGRKLMRGSGCKK